MTLTKAHAQRCRLCDREAGKDFLLCLTTSVKHIHARAYARSFSVQVGLGQEDRRVQVGWKDSKVRAWGNLASLKHCGGREWGGREEGDRCEGGAVGEAGEGVMESNVLSFLCPPSALLKLELALSVECLFMPCLLMQAAESPPLPLRGILWGSDKSVLGRARKVCTHAHMFVCDFYYM